MSYDIFLLLFSECDSLTCRLLYTSVISVNKSYYTSHLLLNPQNNQYIQKPLSIWMQLNTLSYF